MQGRVDSNTTLNLREAYQASLLVFSKKVSDDLCKLLDIAFQSEHKPVERKTDKDWEDQLLLGDELQKVIQQMQTEAALTKWL
jgi:hypothetical protein